MTKAREALDKQIPLPGDGGPISIHFNKRHIDAILTALAGELRTPGTDEVCTYCSARMPEIMDCDLSYCPCKTPTEA